MTISAEPNHYTKPQTRQGSPFAVGHKHLLGWACNDMNEIWKMVYGYDGSYEVSNMGNVRSTSRMSTHSPGIARRLKGRPISQCRLPAGYFQCVLYKDSTPKHRLVHTLVLEAFVGPRPKGMVVCHNDGNPSNNSLDNLRWDTMKNNQADCVIHGTRKFGEDWCRSKLNESQVVEIRLSKEPHTVIARRFNVSPSAVLLVRKRRTWKHIQ